MLVSTKGRYGLRLMVSLASRHGSGPVGVEVMSREQGISGNYIHVLLGALKVSGLLRSVRGRDGGYELTRAPSAITAYDVVVALEGPEKLVECVGDASVCRRSGHCRTRGLWCRIAESIDGILRGVTLQDLVDDVSIQEGIVDYCI
jgi:Rrf2 family protein